MELYVNNSQLDITLESESTVGDVLRSFEMTCEKEGMATIGVNLNGKDITDKEFDSILSVPLEDSTVLNLTVVSSKEIDSAFKTLSNQFEETAKDLEEVPALLQSDSKKAHEIIKKLTDQMDFFCHTATLSALFPKKYGKIDIAGSSLNTFFGELAPILDNLEKAMAQEDTVTVGDIAEYELSPRLKTVSSAFKAL